MKARKRKFDTRTLIVVVVLAAVLFTQQAFTYESGHKSPIFGEKLGFTQSQSMPFNGLVFSVQKISSSTITPYAMANCLGIQGSYALTLRCLQTNDLRYTHNQAYKNKKQYQISLMARNTQKSVALLSNYRFSFDSQSVNILASNTAATEISQGSSRIVTIEVRVPDAVKSTHLQVENGAITKYFKITL